MSFYNGAANVLDLGATTFPSWQTCQFCGCLYQVGTYHLCTPVWTMTTIPTQTGWACPKCSRVYGPTVTECVECNKAVVNKPEQTPELRAEIEKRLKALSDAADRLCGIVRGDGDVKE